MEILALDVATKMGWAHSTGQSGVWDFSIKRDESGGLRLMRFRAKLEEIEALGGVDLVAFEAARHAMPGMQGALVAQSELQGVLKEWCQSKNIDFKGYSPTAIKKHALSDVKGKKRTKQKMVQAAENKWPHLKIIDDNHADALWLLDLVMQEYS